MPEERERTTNADNAPQPSEGGVSSDLNEADLHLPRGTGKIMADTFGGGTFGVIIAVIVLGIGVSAVSWLIDFIDSLDIPVLSYLFSPGFRNSPFGVIGFSFVLIALFGLCVGAIALLANLFEWVADKIRGY